MSLHSTVTMRDTHVRPTFWTAMLERFVGAIKVGTLHVTGPNGYSKTFAGEGVGPSAVLNIRRDKAARALLLGGTNGFADAYMAGDWDTPNLPDLLKLAAANESAFALERRETWPLKMARRVFHLLNANTRRGSKKNIAYHYDLGNAFYEKWLDPSMTYSSALYEEEPSAPLTEAQEAKYHAIARELDLKPGMRVLEVGCGWGGFCEVAARDYGAHVTAITLSREQLAYAQARMARQGLADKVDIRFCDYRDVDGEFDAIVSIEMIEAVGERFLPGYFASLAGALKQGGKAVIQAITIEEQRFARYRASADFIQRHVFPGGFLPTDGLLEATAKAAGLMPQAVRHFGQSYARTLADWHGAFEQAWDDISSLGFDERFRRLWKFYLAYCETGFETGRTNVGHYTFVKPA